MLLSSDQKKFLRTQKKKKIIIFLAQLLLLGIILFGWETLAKYKIINPFIFSSPSRVYDTIKELLINGNLITHILTTLKEIFIAFFLGIIIGFTTAIILYICPILNKILEPYLTMLNSLPKVALGPILIIWFGANTKAIIIMALLINIIISIVNILNGFNSTEEIKIKMMKSLHASKSQILFKLVIPNSYNVIISSLKINISMTLIGVIMGEFLVSKAGIGYLIIYGTQVFNLNLVMAGIVLLGIISFIIYKVISFIESILIKS
ncbi:MAG: ABC transporter permease [Bacilli bacterium]